MCQLPNKQSNMVRVKSDVYNQTALGTQKPVSMVPTVLFVDKTGVISEASSPRDETVMANAITHGITDKVATENVSSPMFTESSYSEPNPLHVLPAEPITHAASANVSSNGVNVASANVASNGANVASANVSPNVASNGANVASNGANVASNGANVASANVAPNVASNGANVASNGVNVASANVASANVASANVASANIKGGRRRQQGGTPFAAFLLAAQQAAPTGLLLGAYATLPPKRRSRETRRTHQRQRRTHQRQRRTRQRRNRQ
jgi:hypothetical protein